MLVRERRRGPVSRPRLGLISNGWDMRSPEVFCAQVTCGEERDRGSRRFMHLVEVQGFPVGWGGIGAIVQREGSSQRRFVWLFRYLLDFEGIDLDIRLLL